MKRIKKTKEKENDRELTINKLKKNEKIEKTKQKSQVYSV